MYVYKIETSYIEDNFTSCQCCGNCQLWAPEQKIDYKINAADADITDTTVTATPLNLGACIISRRTERAEMGFGGRVFSKDGDKSLTKVYSQVEPADLVKYGLIPELVGRLPVIAALQELDEEALIAILTKPKNAIVRQYQALLGMEDVELEFTPDALKAVAEKAIARKTGARGLRSIVEGVLLDAMFDIPTRGNIARARVTRETVEKSAPVELIERD